jgi:hypothetical protein
MYPQLYLAHPGIVAIDATVKAFAAVTSPIVSVLEVIYPPTQRLYVRVTSKSMNASRDSSYESMQAEQQKDLIVLTKAEEGLLEKPSSLYSLSPLQPRCEQP